MELSVIGTLLERPQAGERVRIMFRGELSEPVTVIGGVGSRSADHLVMRTDAGVVFEHYWDSFSVYPA